MSEDEQIPFNNRVHDKLIELEKSISKVNYAKNQMIEINQERIEDLEMKYDVGHGQRIEKLENNQEQIMNIQRGNVDIVHDFKKELSELKTHINRWDTNNVERIEKLEKEFLRCMKDITLSLDNNFKRIESLGKQQGSLYDRMKQWWGNQSPDTHSYYKELSELKNKVRIIEEDCINDSRFEIIAAQIAELKEQIACWIVDEYVNKEVLWELLKALEDWAIEPFKIKCQELLAKLDGEKDEVATLEELGGNEERIPHETLTDSKPSILILKSDLEWLFKLLNKFTVDEMLDPYYGMDDEDEDKMRKIKEKYLLGDDK